MNNTKLKPQLSKFSKSFIFKKGDWAVLKGEMVQIRTAEPDFFVLQSKNNSQPQMYSTDMLYDLYLDGAFSPAVAAEQPVTFRPLNSETDLLEAERRLAYIHDLQSRDNPGSYNTWQKCVDYVSRKIVDPEPPHPKQVYRWLKSWQNSSHSIHQLLKRTQLRSKPLMEQQFDLAMEVIDNEYLVPNGGIKQHVYESFRKQFAQSELEGKAMSRSYFYQIIDSLDPYEVCLAQYGKKAALAKFRASDEKIVVRHLMERVEIDAVHLNLGLIDDETGEFLGKVIVFFAIDVYTRYILGYSVVYGISPGETSEAVIELVSSMIVPKARSGNYRNEWYCLGVPWTIHCDNGSAFIAENTLRFLTHLQITQHRSETGKGQRRPFIERFNRTFRNQLCKKIPGYSGKRVDGNKNDKTIEQSAQVTLSDFNKYVEEYIVDVYHQRQHKGLEGLTPQQAVEEALENFIPRAPVDVSTLNFMSGATKKGTVQATHGIQISKQYFNSKELRELRFKAMGSCTKSPKFDFIFNPKDISQIAVLIPKSMEILLVPNRDKTIAAGTSLADFELSKVSKKLNNRTQPQPVFTSKHKQHKPKTTSKSRKSSSVSKTKQRDPSHTFTDEQLREQLDKGAMRIAQNTAHYTEKAPSEVYASVSVNTTRRKRSEVN
ncbi:DDE-type integrase/transposase/recombinase [Rheinheimera aquimaris]|uniref:DDE-type integrase/transposase/recombinase n=1 Tax=Rheinheimera aquimaris TaxID=412437 RepID=UPI0010669F86|nr:DDE-type integrase/transposase/recombinase [Rheinheimera aquimaris]